MDWVMERTDVMTQLALMDQSLNNLTKSYEEMRIALKETLSSISASLAENKAAVASLQIDVRSRNCEQHSKSLFELHQDMQWMKPAVKVGIWVATALGASVIALIWSIITHAVTIVR